MKNKDDEEKLILLAEDIGLTMEGDELVNITPFRQDIEVIAADKPRELKLGWKVTESIGIGWVNPRGVASGRKSTQDDSPRPKIKKTKLSDG